MPTFAYRAVDATGRRTRGRISGSTLVSATRELETRGLLPIDVQEAAASAQSASGMGFGFGRRRAVLDFTRGVAALLPAGMPLSRALKAATVTVSESARPALDQVRMRVERGEELAAALAEHPRLFSPLYIGVVRAGERSGSLDDAFMRLSTHLERDDELRSKLVSMSIYPALLALVGLASVLVLVLFVLPRFAELLLSAGAALPRITALVLGISMTMREQWRVLLLVPLALLLLFAWLRTTVSGRRVAAVVLTRVPVFGAWRRQALGAAFARMVGELLAGGAPLLNALADARDCMNDPVARDETDRIRTRVREGSSLNAAIAERNVFPSVLAQLVALGEEAGRLSDFLLKSADLLERRTERALERMVALAEPAMIVLFGGVVALVALALLQAIYGVNASSFR
ncbi:type II secretion system F family protein [Piscinibacter sp.]|uniref:type II secretion system F family protein n=1 Tax=Piscinibacter sp. TaxID=1903157 RepID=UPI002CD5049D|nr:type II secretion system F family protein [Albitalea sp.]HUG26109.1 type II secretion system F family protein [Albitalea sp.]